jgi:hypothetical protein
MMEEKALLAPGGPATQEAAAVQILITYINRRHGLPVPESDEALPEFYRLDPGLCLARDAKLRDVYHVAASAGSSCSAGRKPGEPCVHSRRFFPAKEVKAFEKGVARNVLQS